MMPDKKVGDAEKKTNRIRWELVMIALPTLFLALILGREIIFKKGDISVTIGGFKDVREQLQRQDQQKGGVVPKTLSADDIKKLLDKGPRDLPVAKVLWVDDHPINNQVARLALGALGIFCDSYTNTSDAIDALNWNSRNSKKPYDLIISDWRRDNEIDSNGHTMSGIDTYRHVRELPGYRDTPFVFFTADGIDAVQPIVSQDPKAASTTTSMSC
jgi:CheY-like chemotaxis protein